MKASPSHSSLNDTDQQVGSTTRSSPQWRGEDGHQEDKAQPGQSCSGGDRLHALVSRLVFLAHGALAGLWVVCTMPWCHYYTVFIAGFVFMLVETLVNLIGLKGRGYRRFSPNILFYLLTLIPCVWIIELDALQQRIDHREPGLPDATNRTDNLTDQANVTTDNTVQVFAGLAIHTLAPAEMTLVVEQLLIFILILGRWMLPKGELSRDELSQLLLTYIALGADIAELFSVFEEETVAYDSTLTLAILAIWSTSLTQFTFVSTAMGNNKDAKEAKSTAECCSSEVFGILSSMFLQDLPFLGLRLLLLVEYDIYSYMNIFFCVKNLLGLLLTSYRLAILFCSQQTDPEAPGDLRDAEKRL